MKIIEYARLYSAKNICNFSPIIYNENINNIIGGGILLEFIKNFVQKYSKLIVTINIILLIFSIGFGKATVLNSVIIFLLFLLLVFMPDKAFDDDEDSDEKF